MSGLFKALQAVYGEADITDNCKKISESVTWFETLKAFFLAFVNYAALTIPGLIAPGAFASEKDSKNRFEKLKVNLIKNDKTFKDAVVKAYDVYINADKNSKDRSFFDTLDENLGVQLEFETKQKLLDTLSAMYGNNKIGNEYGKVSEDVTWGDFFNAISLATGNYATLGIAEHVPSTRECKNTFGNFVTAAKAQAAAELQVQ